MNTSYILTSPWQVGEIQRKDVPVVCQVGERTKLTICRVPLNQKFEASTLAHHIVQSQELYVRGLPQLQNQVKYEAKRKEWASLVIMAIDALENPFELSPSQTLDLIQELVELEADLRS